MKNHVENSKKFELDRLLIKKIYNIKEKKKFEYKVIKKNVIYDKEITRQYSKFLDVNKSNYYGNYQSFREYLSSGYNYYFLVNEINNIKSLLGYSQNIRQMAEIKLNPNLKNNIKPKSFIQNPAILESSESSDNFIINTNQQSQKINNNLYQNASSLRRPSTVFQIDKENPLLKKIGDLAHKSLQVGPNNQSKKKFIESCHLLKLKEEEMKKPQNQYQFRIYSKLSEEFDPFFLPEYEKFVNAKYENQKSNLIRIYNNERAFINCVTSIKDKLKYYVNMNNRNKQSQDNSSDSLRVNTKETQPSIKPNFNMPQYKLQLKIPYINAFYFGRTDLYFKDIDNFMSMYKENTSLASKRLEKDFFENLYKILTYNNTDCKRFLHYLYSNSYFFKYIYNIFTTQNKSDVSLKNFAPSIKRHNDEDHFLNDSIKELFFSEAKEKEPEDENLLIMKEKQEEERKQREKNELNQFFNSLIGNEFTYKINIIPENLAEFVNKKKKSRFKRIISDEDKYEENCIITLSSNENMLEIYNIEEKEYLFSSYFDENISIYDLEKDLKNNIKLDNINKNEKYILISQLNNSSQFANSFLIKLSKEIYTRFSKSISAKGIKMKKTELFSSEENVNKEKEEKINLADMMSLQGEEEKNQNVGDVEKNRILNSENESDKHSSTKNEKNIKFDQRNPSRSMTFRKSSADKSNSGIEKSDNEEKEQMQKNDSSLEVKDKEKDEEESEDEENEDEMKEESDGEEDENDKDSDEENNKKNKQKDANPINKNKGNIINKEKSEEEENSSKDNINNLSEDKENNKSEENDSAKNVNNNKRQKNLEEINTDMDNFFKGNNQTIKSESKSSEKED